MIKKEVNRAEELEKLKTVIVENMKKMCSYCNIIPYQNQLGIGYTSKKQIICEVCLMSQLEPKYETDCTNSEKCGMKVKLVKQSAKGECRLCRMQQENIPCYACNCQKPNIIICIKCVIK